MPVNPSLKGLCNVTIKYGICKRGKECFFAPSHEKALAMHLKFKNEGKCVWCELGHCKKCHVPKKKPAEKSIKVDSEGWQIVGKKIPDKPIEEQLLDWLRLIKQGEEVDMPKFEGKIKFSFEDKNYVFIQGKGFVVKTKTIVEIKELNIKDIPISVSDAWRSPSDTIYSAERQEIEKLLNQKEDDDENVPFIESIPVSEDENDEEETKYWNSMQEIGQEAKKNIYQEFSDVWEEFDD